MSDLDVTMRLRLQQDIDKEAKRAKEGLKELDKAFDRLKGTNLDLDKDLSQVAAAARKANQPINDLVRDVKKLNHVETAGVEREIKAVGTASVNASLDVAKIKTKMGEVNVATTDAATGEIKAIGAASTSVLDNLEAVRAKLGAINGLNTNMVEAEIRQIGKAAQDARRDLDNVKINNKTTVGKQDHRLDVDQEVKRRPGMNMNVPNALGVAWLASQVDETAKWINNIGDAKRQLERAEAAVAVTVEQRDPATIAKISKSNTDLSRRYGLDRWDVNVARQTLAGAGVGVDSQEKILDPTIKTAKASESSPSEVADAAIAAKQNLGLKDSEIPAFYDQMARGVNLGRFEVDAMSKNMPKLAAAYQKTGRKGLDATSELIAFAQVARRTSGSSDDAATNMQNYFGKLFADDSVKNFKDLGIDLNKVREQSLKNNTPYFLDVIDQMIKVADGDPMKASALFPDQQARSAADAMAANRQLYTEWQKKIRNESTGAVDESWDFLKNTEAEKKARSDQAYKHQYEDTTGAVGGIIAPVIDNIGRMINRKYNEERFLEDVPMLDKQSVGRRAELEAELKRLQDTGDSGATILGPRMAQIRAELQALAEEDAIRKSEQERLTRERAIDPATTNAIADKPVKASTRKGDYLPVGDIPIPLDRPVTSTVSEKSIRNAKSIDRPVEAAVGKDMSGAAEQSMDSYKKALQAGVDQAVNIASAAAERMKSILSFTATPTISPNMVNPGNSTTTKSVPGKQSSLSSTTNTKVTQHISTPSSKRAAAIAMREQDRAVRMARARAYSDMGSMPA